MPCGNLFDSERINAKKMSATFDARTMSKMNFAHDHRYRVTVGYKVTQPIPLVFALKWFNTFHIVLEWPVGLPRSWLQGHQGTTTTQTLLNVVDSSHVNMSGPQDYLGDLVATDFVATDLVATQPCLSNHQDSPAGHC